MLEHVFLVKRNFTVGSVDVRKKIFWGFSQVRKRVFNLKPRDIQKIIYYRLNIKLLLSSHYLKNELNVVIL